MTAHPDHTDLHLDEEMHHAPRRKSTRRILARVFLFLCAISIGVILASDPKVTQFIADTGKGASTPGSEEPVSSGHPEADSGGTGFPTGAFSALSALTKSARSVLGTASQGEDASTMADSATPDDPAQDSPAASTGSGGFFSFGSGSNTSQPIVSAMPQNRIPVRRAGVSN